MEPLVTTAMWTIKVKISLSASRLDQGCSNLLYYLKRMSVKKCTDE